MAVCIHSVSLDENTDKMIEDLQNHVKETDPGRGYNYYTQSAIVRRAVKLAHQHVVLGESLICDDDPRFY